MTFRSPVIDRRLVPSNPQINESCWERIPPPPLSEYVIRYRARIGAGWVSTPEERAGRVCVTDGRVGTKDHQCGVPGEGERIQ